MYRLKIQKMLFTVSTSYLHSMSGIESPPSHVIISLNAARDDHGPLSWHRADFNGSSFHTLCGHDDKIDTPALVRFEDVETTQNRTLTADAQCQDCYKRHLQLTEE